jgi:ribosome-associated protein
MRIVEAALDRKAEEPVVLDVRQLTAYADTFIILSGRSDRQVRSIAEAVIHALKANGEQPLGVEGLEEGNWVLIDCNDAIVHVFDPETRESYDLERLWRDAPRLVLDITAEGVEMTNAKVTDANMTNEEVTDQEVTAQDVTAQDVTAESDAADPAA